jgi:DNA-binding MarR family transcriptional regulator
MADGLSQMDIMAITGIDRSSVASLVAKLAKMELVARQKRQSDNRAYAVHLTQEGEKALRRNRVIAERVDEQLLSLLERRERSELLKMLRRLARSPREICTPQSEP